MVSPADGGVRGGGGSSGDRVGLRLGQRGIERGPGRGAAVHGLLRRLADRDRVAPGGRVVVGPGHGDLSGVARQCRREGPALGEHRLDGRWVLCVGRLERRLVERHRPLARDGQARGLARCPVRAGGRSPHGLADRGKHLLGQAVERGIPVEGAGRLGLRVVGRVGRNGREQLVGRAHQGLDVIGHTRAVWRHGDGHRCCAHRDEVDGDAGQEAREVVGLGSHLIAPRAAH